MAVDTMATAVLPDHAHVGEVLKALKAIDGVEDVDIDNLRQAY